MLNFGRTRREDTGQCEEAGLRQEGKKEGRKEGNVGRKSLDQL